MKVRSAISTECSNAVSGILAELRGWSEEIAIANQPVAIPWGDRFEAKKENRLRRRLGMGLGRTFRTSLVPRPSNISSVNPIPRTPGQEEALPSGASAAGAPGQPAPSGLVSSSADARDCVLYGDEVADVFRCLLFVLQWLTRLSSELREVAGALYRGAGAERMKNNVFRCSGDS